MQRHCHVTCARHHYETQVADTTPSCFTATASHQPALWLCTCPVLGAGALDGSRDPLHGGGRRHSAKGVGSQGCNQQRCHMHLGGRHSAKRVGNRAATSN